MQRFRKQVIYFNFMNVMGRVFLRLLLIVPILPPMFLLSGYHDSKSAAFWKKSLHAKNIQTIKDEANSRDFSSAVIKKLGVTCHQIPVGRVQNFQRYFEHCSDEAKRIQAMGKKVTENFVVPTEFARVFNFWKKVYSVWTSEHIILHTQAYPEIVFEVFDLNRKETWDEEAKKLAEDDLKRSRIEYFEDFLKNLQVRMNSRADLSDEELRVVGLMDHINDSNKFEKAAEGLRFQQGQRDNIQKGLETSSLYLSSIQKEFEALGLPMELANLGFSESCFDLNAISKVGAVGVFQIMESTGKHFLMINDLVDERLDPVKAGRAAAKLLRNNYAVLGSWPLAITAYNHGASGLLRGMAETGESDLFSLIKKYENRRFGFASKNFYLSFLAVLDSVKNSELVFSDSYPLPALKYKSVLLSKRYHVGTVTDILEISETQLAFYNPDISKKLIENNGVLPKDFEIKVPVE